MTKNKRVLRAKRNTIKFPYYQDWTNASLPFTNYCSLTTNNNTMNFLQLWCSLLKDDEACAVQTTRAVLSKPPGGRHLQKQPWITPVPSAPASLKHRLWGERWSRAGIPGLVQREGTTGRAAFMGCNVRDPSGTWKTKRLWTAAQNTGQDGMQIIEFSLQVTRSQGF